MPDLFVTCYELKAFVCWHRSFSSWTPFESQGISAWCRACAKSEALTYSLPSWLQVIFFSCTFRHRCSLDVKEIPRSAWCLQAPDSLLFLFLSLPSWKIRIILYDGVQLGVDREHPADVFDRRHCYFLRLIPTRGHRISSCLSVCYTCTDLGRRTNAQSTSYCCQREFLGGRLGTVPYPFAYYRVWVNRF